ncbi:hypothetical protein [Streptomyces bobili]|uniref:hypothetical protein n=1 Tax=Streptomyces bobili TaxID=67280 RepID=UPI003790464B
MHTARPAQRLTPNMFGTPFGVCGLATCWSTAHVAIAVPAWPADVLWALAALLWLVCLVARQQRDAGEAVFVVGLITTLALGGWLTTRWITAEQSAAGEGQPPRPPHPASAGFGILPYLIKELP